MINNYTDAILVPESPESTVTAYKISSYDVVFNTPFGQSTLVCYDTMLREEERKKRLSILEQLENDD